MPNKPPEKKRIVVKVGSSTLTRPETGRLHFAHIDLLCRTLCDLLNAGHEIILVTSGAVAVGLSKLGLKEKPEEMAKKQAAAAIGQCELMFIYDKIFSDYGHITAQVLLTKDVTDQPSCKENVINSLSTLLELGVVPIVNENDSVSYEEIELGDNDTLSAIVAGLVKADLLVILTDIDGLFDKNPSEHKDARLIPVVSEITPEIEKNASGAGSAVGTGGMITKLSAASIAMAHGIDMVVANGADPYILYDIVAGKPKGTLFKGN